MINKYSNLFLIVILYETKQRSNINSYACLRMDSRAPYENVIQSIISQCVSVNTSIQECLVVMVTSQQFEIAMSRDMETFLQPSHCQYSCIKSY